MSHIRNCKLEAEAIFKIDSIINLHMDEIHPDIFYKLSSTIDNAIEQIYHRDEAERAQALV